MSNYYNDKTMKIIKARFASDGQIFRDCIFNNDTMEIKIIDDKYRGLKYNKVKKYGEDEINKLEKIIDIHAKISENVLDKVAVKNKNTPLEKIKMQQYIINTMNNINNSSQSSFDPSDSIEYTLINYYSKRFKKSCIINFCKNWLTPSDFDKTSVIRKNELFLTKEVFFGQNK
jgi:CxxC motif-containing protein